MVTTNPLEQGQIVGKGKARLLCETRFNFEPSMSKIIGETYDVRISDCTVFNGRVLVKGIVEKTCYYKHPHLGKKNNNEKEDGKKDDNNKEDCKEEENKKEDGKKDDNRKEDGKKDNNKKDSNKKDNNKKDDTQKDDCKKDSATINKLDSTCLDDSCERVDSYGGIIHFYEEYLEFASTIEIKGAMPGDTCHVVVAEVRDYESFVATERGPNGLINAGKQMFIVDICLGVTRNKCKAPGAKQEDMKRIILIDNLKEKNKMIIPFLKK